MKKPGIGKHAVYMFLESANGPVITRDATVIGFDPTGTVDDEGFMPAHLCFLNPDRTSLLSTPDWPLAFDRVLSVPHHHSIGDCPSRHAYRLLEESYPDPPTVGVQATSASNVIHVPHVPGTHMVPGKPGVIVRDKVVSPEAEGVVGEAVSGLPSVEDLDKDAAEKAAKEATAGNAGETPSEPKA